MRTVQKPPFQQKAVAIGFTVGFHVVAIVGLLFLGMSKPPEPPKTIKAVLIDPKDLKPVTREETEFTDTASENIATDITQTAQPITDAARIPAAPPPPALAATASQVDQAKAAQDAKKAQDKAEQLAAEDAQRAKAKADAAAKAEADTAAKAKADADAKAKADTAAKAKADADAKTKADAKAKADAAAKAKADTDAKAKADADAKAKADVATKAKADTAAKAKADADAKAKADAAAKAKADAAAKAKADADAKAKADADAKARAAEEAKASAAKQAAQEAAQKKAEATRIASTAKRDFENKIRRSWDPPMGSTGKKATARIQLDDNGNVRSVVVTSSDPDVKASVEAAIRAAAPYPMPSDPDARQQAKSVTSTFTAN